jgi:hypothetical protein
MKKREKLETKTGKFIDDLCVIDLKRVWVFYQVLWFPPPIKIMEIT